jgi:hypothetical protein
VSGDWIDRHQSTFAVEDVLVVPTDIAAGDYVLGAHERPGSHSVRRACSPLTGAVHGAMIFRMAVGCGDDVPDLAVVQRRDHCVNDMHATADARGRCPPPAAAPLAPSTLALSPSSSRRRPAGRPLGQSLSGAAGRLHQAIVNFAYTRPPPSARCTRPAAAAGAARDRCTLNISSGQEQAFPKGNPSQKYRTQAAGRAAAAAPTWCCPAHALQRPSPPPARAAPHTACSAPAQRPARAVSVLNISW